MISKALNPPQTLVEKIWNRHVVDHVTGEGPDILFIDTHLLHEVTSHQGFSELKRRNLPVFDLSRTFATLDHAVPTKQDAEGKLLFHKQKTKDQTELLRANCREFGVELFDLGTEHNGIVHVIGPELGISRPGSTIVCGDSHTCTHGALGALAFGIGATEVGHVLATQALLMKKPESFRISYRGNLPQNCTAKDLILYSIAVLGTGWGKGGIVEYCGSAVDALSIEGRLTLCNMSVELGARSGIIAPDQKVFDYLKGRPFFQGQRHAEKNGLYSDSNAEFAKEVEIDIKNLKPMVTYGTNPSLAIKIGSSIPKLTQEESEYMGFSQGQQLLGTPVNIIFVGSCTNGRLEDFEAVAQILKGKKIAKDVNLVLVPGSQAVKKAAEDQGLAKIFIESGASWREPGCSYCVAMNGDYLKPGELALSTSNRNFKGRQGPGSRTILCSPQIAAYSALNGKISEV